MTDVNKSMLNDIKIRPGNARDLADWYIEVLDSPGIKKLQLVHILLESGVLCKRNIYLKIYKNGEISIFDDRTVFYKK